MEDITLATILKEIEKQISFSKIQEIVVKGERIEGEITCPKCKEQTVFHIYPHKIAGRTGIGIMSYCEKNKCYSLIT